jgi:hypothetical protein
MSEKLHAVAQQNNRPFVQVAASIKRRTYRSRTKPTLGFRPWPTQHRIAAAALCFLHARRISRFRPFTGAEIRVTQSAHSLR